MLCRLLKPCPRCRGDHLIEMLEDWTHVVKCVQCGYLLRPEEIRFLFEDGLRQERADCEKTAA